MTVTEGGPLTGSELNLTDASWRATNYLSVRQIYLLGNPLLAEHHRKRRQETGPTGRPGPGPASWRTRQDIEIARARYGQHCNHDARRRLRAPEPGADLDAGGQATAWPPASPPRPTLRAPSADPSVLFRT